MLRHLTTCLSIAASVALAQDPPPKPAPEAPKKVALGQALPADLALRDLSGKEHVLATHRGKVLVLHFWSSSCPWEVAAEPKLNAFAAEYGKKGVVVYGVAANFNEIGERPDPEAFTAEDEKQRPYPKLRQKAKESAVNHPILADHGAVLGKLLEARTTPHVFVFDRKGVLVYTGALDDDGRAKDPTRAANYVRSAVDAVLAGEEVGLAETRPYG